MNKKNKVVEANEFTQKVLNQELGSVAHVFEFKRTFDPPHCEYCHRVGIKMLGTIFYSRTFSPSHKIKSFQDIVNKTKEDISEYINVMQNNNGDKEALKDITRLTILEKYKEDEFIQSIYSDKEGWDPLLKEVYKYLLKETQASNIEKYTNCIDNFKSYLQDKRRKQNNEFR